MKKSHNNSFFRLPHSHHEQSVIGTLSPIYWDRSGKVMKFSIYSDTEEDIIIDNYKNKRKLKKLLNKRVQAKGKVQTNKWGDKYIRIKSIKELADPESPPENLLETPRSHLWIEDYPLSFPKEHMFSKYISLEDLSWETG